MSANVNLSRERVGSEANYVQARECDDERWCRDQSPESRPHRKHSRKISRRSSFQATRPVEALVSNALHDVRRASCAAWPAPGCQVAALYDLDLICDPPLPATSSSTKAAPTDFASQKSWSLQQVVYPSQRSLYFLLPCSEGIASLDDAQVLGWRMQFYCAFVDKVPPMRATP